MHSDPAEVKKSVRGYMTVFAMLMVFTVLTFAQLFHVMAIRSERESLFTIGLVSNRLLLGAVLLGAALQLAVIYVPALNDILKTQPLTAGELALCVLLPSLVFVAIEVEKWLMRRGLIYRRTMREAA